LDHVSPNNTGHVDGGAARADNGDRHRATAHLIIPDEGQQAAMQDAELLAKRPPDNEKGFE
jgi:hypothetical protein